MAAFLIPTDLSEAALNAAVLGVRLFGTGNNTYTFVHNYIDPGLADPLVLGATPGLMEELQRSLDEWIERFERTIGRDELIVDGELAIGTVAGTVHELTREGLYALVIIGAEISTGSSWFASAAGDAVKVSKAPVLVVPAGARMEQIQRIVLADDGGDIRPSALKLVGDIARAQSAEVLVLRVIPTNAADLSVDGSPLHNAMFGGVQHSFTVIHADETAHAIDEFALGCDAGLVAVLHRHVDLIGELFHSSMARRMATMTHLPLLVLEQ